MEQQNKYYTPDISELHIGYECELLVPKSTDPFVLGRYDDVWVQMSFTKPWRIADVQKGESQVRTKYLDQSDIESCGWEIDVEKEKRRKNHVTAPYISKGKNGMLSQHGENYMISTIIGPPTEDSYGGLGQPMYMGPIKSINELRTIMKYLNIK